MATDKEIDAFTKVRFLHKKHIKNLFFGHLDINLWETKERILNLW